MHVGEVREGGSAPSVCSKLEGRKMIDRLSEREIRGAHVSSEFQKLKKISSVTIVQHLKGYHTIADEDQARNPSCEARRLI